MKRQMEEIDGMLHFSPYSQKMSYHLRALLLLYLKEKLQLQIYLHNQ